MSKQSATDTPARLPRKNGHRPRVAMLVYNDAHNDARVLKEAAALRDAGATVRIFAVARRRAGYPEGTEQLSNNLDVLRSPEFELARQAPWLLNLGRKLTGRKAPAPNTPETGSTPAPHTPVITTNGDGFLDDQVEAAEIATAHAIASTAKQLKSLTKQAKSSASRVGKDFWLRTYRTVSLSLYWEETARAALDWQPDVVHANDGNTLAPALWIVQRCPAKLVYDSHELWLHRNVRADRPLAPHVEARIEALGIRRADAVITVSPSIVQWLTEHYHLDTPPALVRNVPAAGPQPERARGRLHELAGLGAEAKIIAYGGRITTSRGIEETLAALAHLPNDVHLVMLGYGEADYLDTIWAAAAQHGVAERVHQVGPVAPHEVSDALCDADVSVVHVRPTCLSYRFALPNKLFESIRGGLPVAAADLPDLRAVVEELGVGEVFSGDDPAAMAATIAQILADPQRYRDAALAACPDLTWEREATQLVSVYRRVLLGERA